jgi:hypothetical protein
LVSSLCLFMETDCLKGLTMTTGVLCILFLHDLGKHLP